MTLVWVLFGNRAFRLDGLVAQLRTGQVDAVRSVGSVLFCHGLSLHCSLAREVSCASCRILEGKRLIDHLGNNIGVYP